MALTMAIEQNRIEAMGKYCYQQWAHGARLVAWEDIATDHKQLWEKYAVELIGIAYPELASDPPTGWVAPWDSSNAIDCAAIDLPAPHARDEEYFEAVWSAMRDAHLKEQGE